MNHFVVRNRSTDYLRHLVMPIIGFAILLFVVITPPSPRRPSA
ncbi:hypothetical protein [Georgenia sp. SUBG003]